MTQAQFGTVSHGTMRAEDLIPTFSDTLRDLCNAEKRFSGRANADHIKLCDEADAIIWKDNSSENYDGTENITYATDQYEIDGILEELFDALDEYAPPYSYFGTHEGDGSDYGYWLSHDSLDEAFGRHGDGLRVSDLSEVPDHYVGEVLLVNDHGNCTLYAFDEGKPDQPREIWGIV